LKKTEKENEAQLKGLRKSLDLHRNREVEIKSRLSELQTELHLQTEEIEEKLDISKEEIPSLEVDPSITLGKTEKRDSTTTSITG